MHVATRAVLLPLDALRVEALVLRGEVVAILALAAGENDLVAGHVWQSGEWKWRVGVGSGEWGVGSGEWGVGSESESEKCTPTLTPHSHSYFRIFVTTPAPTVRPP